MLQFRISNRDWCEPLIVSTVSQNQCKYGTSIDISWHNASKMWIPSLCLCFAANQLWPIAYQKPFCIQSMSGDKNNTDAIAWVCSVVIVSLYLSIFISELVKQSNCFKSNNKNNKIIPFYISWYEQIAFFITQKSFSKHKSHFFLQFG